MCGDCLEQIFVAHIMPFLIPTHNLGHRLLNVFLAVVNLYWLLGTTTSTVRMLERLVYIVGWPIDVIRIESVKR